MYLWILLLSTVVTCHPAGYHVVLEPSIGYVIPAEVTHTQGYLYNAPAIPFRGSLPFPAKQQQGKYPLKAECLLVAANISSVSGELHLVQSSALSAVLITGTVYGLNVGAHGFHLHMHGDTKRNCAAAGSHFNPRNKTHGGPADDNRHAGDFGNIIADRTGVADVSVTTDMITLSPGEEGSVLGRSIVVHELNDDLGKGGNEESLKTGNAGARLACCVVRKRYHS